MDVRLMKEFEELEGLTDQNSNDEVVLDEQEDDDPSFRPTVASTLNNSDVYYEMDKRNLKTTGFPDTDREILQKAFDSEFHQDLENARALRREVRRRAARQAGLQKRRMNMEKLLQEEQNELAKNHYSGMMIELIKENKLDASCRIDANSISARSLAKALWSNNTITCLDLSSNGLNDHAGSYLARSLKRNNSIRKLELDSNAFGPSTCVAFGEALRVNTTLMSLSLDSNPLSDYNGSNLHGITALAEVLGVNKTLKSLNLWRTGVGPEGGAIITRNMLRNTTLLFLDVSHNDFAMKDMVKLASQLEKNLASFEQQERRRRNQAELDMQEEHKQKCIEEGKTEQKELSRWLEERRRQRAESRRLEEEENQMKLKAEADERRRVALEEKERERKALEEAEAKKKKKKAGKKK